jgi:cation:H+ antiporter
VGSNIANIALILGVTALISPLIVNSRILRREMPLLLGVMAFSGLLLWDGHLGRLDGACCWSALAGCWPGSFTTGCAGAAMHTTPSTPSSTRRSPGRCPHPAHWSGWSGLVLLLASARVLVWGAVNVAEALGVSDLIIGLTIIAIGTSLPELAASVVAARHGEPDIAIGNVVGSNIFNLLGVLAFPGLIHPAAVPGEVLSRDYPVMAA